MLRCSSSRRAPNGESLLGGQGRVLIIEDLTTRLFVLARLTASPSRVVRIAGMIMNTRVRVWRVRNVCKLMVIYIFAY